MLKPKMWMAACICRHVRLRRVSVDWRGAQWHQSNIPVSSTHYFVTRCYTRVFRGHAARLHTWVRSGGTQELFQAERFLQKKSGWGIISQNRSQPPTWPNQRKCHLLSDGVFASIIVSIVFFAQLNTQIQWEGNSCWHYEVNSADRCELASLHRSLHGPHWTWYGKAIENFVPLRKVVWGAL